MSWWRLSTRQNNRETRQTNEEVRCGLGSPGQTEKRVRWDNRKGRKRGDHLTVGLGLLRPQPAPEAGGKEGCPIAGGPCNLPAWPCSAVDLPHEPGDRFPWLLSTAGAPHVGEEQLSYLCKALPKDGEMLLYRGTGEAMGLAQCREKPQCYLVGFAWTRHPWGLCLVLPGDPQ